TNLSANTYSVIVNIEGCAPETLSFTISQPDPIVVAAVISNRIATVTSSGGNGEFVYEWSDNVILTNSTRDFTSSPAGTYCVTVRDKKGCRSSSPACIVVPPGTGN